VSPGEAKVLFGVKERKGPTVMSWFVDGDAERTVRGKESSIKVFGRIVELGLKNYDLRKVDVASRIFSTSHWKDSSRYIPWICAEELGLSANITTSYFPPGSIVTCVLIRVIGRLQISITG
jgi:hypothetical protein